MSQIKKLYITLFALASFTAAHIQIQADYQRDEFDEFLDDPEVNMFLDDNEFTYVRRTNCTPADMFQTVEEILDPFIELFKEDIFLRTQPCTRRSILDLPNGMLDKDYAYNDWIIGTELFYNTTDRSYFAHTSDFIGAYLALSAESFLYKLDAVSKELKQFGDFDFDPADIFLLFKNGTIQERRLGFLLYGKKNWRRWSFSWKIPLYYLERNYWFTEEEQEAIEKEFGALDEEQQRRLEERYLISDKLGCGDTRLEADFSFGDPRFDRSVGLQVTIPTAWAPAKGLKGHYFEVAPRPEINLTDIFCLALDDTTRDDAFDELLKYAYKVFDHLSVNVLDEPLGNNGHFGVGLFLKSTIPLDVFIKSAWAYNIKLKSLLSLEYLLPAKEKRFFAECIDPRLFDMRDFVIDNPTDVTQMARAEKNMAFLNEQFTNHFFPFAFDTWVYPGFIFRWTSKAVYENNRWGLHLGSDTWIKTQESFGEIYDASPLITNQLKTKNAKKMLGYQSKLFGSLFYKIQRSNRDWTISLNADGTILNRGIGKDYSISINMEVDF